MKLSKRQFCIAVRTYQSMQEEEREITTALGIVEWNPSDWINDYYELLSDMCELEEDHNMGTILDWFVFETDFGRRKDYCKIYDEGKTWTIDSPEVLYDYIVTQ